MVLDQEVLEDLQEGIGEEKGKRFFFFVQHILEKAKEELIETANKSKVTLKQEVVEELKKELATREYVDIKFQELKTEVEQVKGELKTEIEQVKGELKQDITQVRGEIKNLSLMIKLLIALSILALTLLNPNFVTLIEKVFG